jgi:hypothetical protein
MKTTHRTPATPEDATLLDVLVDGFEKNEVMRGFHWRTLPMRDELAAVRKYESLVAEARAWKGAPVEESSQGKRRSARWNDLQVRQLGRGVMVLARAPRFDDWWHAEDTWRDDPFGPMYEWLDEGGS